MERWENLKIETKTPEAGFREAELRIGEWQKGMLNLSRLKLQQIPEQLSTLTGLKTLYLYDNQISDLNSLKYLKNIVTLGLSRNKIKNIEHLGNLRGLKKLHLDINEISDIKHLRELKNLTLLNLSRNNINDIKHLRELKFLSELRLNNNNIIKIKHLRGLQKLNMLDLQNNQISNIKHLENLKELTSVYLGNNPISSIKPLSSLIEFGKSITFREVASLKKNEINLRDCPLEDPPLEIAKQGTAAVLKYWEEQEKQGTTYQNEGRLMILGKGKVGKTSLLKKLQDPNCDLDPDENQTHGINIWRDWKFPVPNKTNQTFTASAWDFGGQDVQHLTHQYFLTPGTVYVVMVNKRSTNTSDEYVDLDYWFRIITALGRYPGQRARVLVVHNRFSTDGTAAGIDLSELEERYKDSLKLSLHTVNIKDEADEMALLRGKIEAALLNLPGVGNTIIKGWPAVRTALGAKRATKKRIGYDDYVDLCVKEGIESDSGQRLLLSYLVRLGEVIHYDGTGMLANYVLLDIDWITKTVYGITQNQDFIDREGRFERSKIIDIWKAQDIHRPTDHNLMLELLQVNAFELCWKRDETRFLTPTLFSPKMPPGVTPVRADLGLRYGAKYLPDGLMGQLIVRLHGLAEKEAWWRKGIYLYDPETKCRALVRQPIAKHHLSITVEGPSPQNYSLLRLVKKELDTVIERSFSRIEFTQSIPCPCATCKRDDREQHYFSVKKLQQNKTDGKTKVHCTHENSTPIAVLMEGLARAQGLRVTGFSQQLRQLVGGGKLKEAVDLIEQQHPGDKATMIKLAYTDLLGKQVVGVLSPEEQTRFRQQLAQKLLSFGDLLESTGGQGTTTATIERGLAEIKAQLTDIQVTGEDTNARVRNLETAIDTVQQDLDHQGENLFANRKEQRAFINRLEEFVEALPEDKQPGQAWYDADTKQKIKVGIDFIKLLNKATGIELEGMNVKWERELDMSQAKLPGSWAEFKRWFLR